MSPAGPVSEEDPSSYGEAMADVYDEWYSDISDVAATVALLADLAGHGPALELGVGTGRLALPLAAAGVVMHGVDASPAMLARLRAKPGGEAVAVTVGDMAEAVDGGPFRLTFVAYNTFFNLTTAEAQRRCLRSVASVLAPGGHFVIEAFVPEVDKEADAVAEMRLEVSRIDAERVVLLASRHDRRRQDVAGHFVELSEAGGVRLRPWHIRYAGPGELDTMAAEAGLELYERFAGWQREPFDEGSGTHVSIYRYPQAEG